MISKEKIFRLIRKLHSSEKTSYLVGKTNTIVLKVAKNANKREIFSAVEKIFEVKVKNINTLIVKGKIKKRQKHKSYRENWKKAYITLKEGQNLDFVSGSE
ncbi:50S ribosomal protein L23 [Candidatus Pantoea edessiphila]|uniref:Large ribosomal subunit protein uL23 n=1 Tax=Candidatus Pantoea edessiphila TaxID=2044610 RepID=A0A2P5SXW7_9GAMM|nr:50S ribosomal protein L23 [Candidatus Pantoea edessiphila]MBK4775780.1 50S ribosomal protein L23 [Pantoea sp. Edef]PPI87176.1 50S ribosomal protein L23 [Candidatus Pantoea edessiphila]